MNLLDRNTKLWSIISNASYFKLKLTSFPQMLWSIFVVDLTLEQTIQRKMDDMYKITDASYHVVIIAAEIKT